MLQRARGVDVLFVNDNSADTNDNWPNGTKILTTHVQSFSHDLTRMPYIPEVATFVKKGLIKRATIFRCDEASKITIVYLLNSAQTYPSNMATAKFQYLKMETRKMIENGMAVAMQNGDEAWVVLFSERLIPSCPARVIYALEITAMEFDTSLFTKLDLANCRPREA